MPPSKSKKKVEAEPTQETVIEEAPKKKGKKPVKVVAIVTPQGIEGSFQEPRRPLIVHLGIRPSDISFTEGAAEVEPYDASTRDVFSEAQENLEVMDTKTKDVLTVPVTVQEVKPCRVLRR